MVGILLVHIWFNVHTCMSFSKIWGPDNTTSTPWQTFALGFGFDLDAEDICLCVESCFTKPDSHDKAGNQSKSSKPKVCVECLHGNIVPTEVNSGISLTCACSQLTGLSWRIQRSADALTVFLATSNCVLFWLVAVVFWFCLPWESQSVAQCILESIWLALRESSMHCKLHLLDQTKSQSAQCIATVNCSDRYARKSKCSMDVNLNRSDHGWNDLHRKGQLNSLRPLRTVKLLQTETRSPRKTESNTCCMKGFRKSALMLDRGSMNALYKKQNGTNNRKKTLLQRLLLLQKKSTCHTQLQHSLATMSRLVLQLQ